MPDVEDASKLKCTLHGWKLDPATMTYCSGSNPKLAGFTMKQAEGTKQPELAVTANADGSIALSLPEGGGACSLA